MVLPFSKICFIGCWWFSCWKWKFPVAGRSINTYVESRDVSQFVSCVYRVQLFTALSNCHLFVVDARGSNVWSVYCHYVWFPAGCHLLWWNGQYLSWHLFHLCKRSLVIFIFTNTVLFLNSARSLPLTDACFIALTRRQSYGMFDRISRARLQTTDPLCVKSRYHVTFDQHAVRLNVHLDSQIGFLAYRRFEGAAKIASWGGRSYRQ